MKLYLFFKFIYDKLIVATDYLKLLQIKEKNQHIKITAV